MVMTLLQFATIYLHLKENNVQKKTSRVLIYFMMAVVHLAESIASIMTEIDV